MKENAARVRKAAFLFAWLLAGRASALGSARRRGFLPTDGNYIDLGRPLDLVRSSRNLSRLLVNEALALVVAEDHFVVVHRFQVLRQERHLASPAWGVDHELRNREARRPSAQRLDDLEALLHCCAE